MAERREIVVCVVNYRGHLHYLALLLYRVSSVRPYLLLDASGQLRGADYDVAHRDPFLGRDRREAFLYVLEQPL